MRRRSRRSLAVVEMTPLIDVVFLLVVFFLVAADATRVSRPAVVLVPGPGEAPVGPQWDLVLTLGVDGLWRERAGAGPFDLGQRTFAADTTVLLRAHRDAAGASFLAMTDQLRQAGLHRVDLSLGPEVSQ